MMNPWSIVFQCFSPVAAVTLPWLLHIPSCCGSRSSMTCSWLNISSSVSSNFLLLKDMKMAWSPVSDWLFGFILSSLHAVILGIWLQGFVGFGFLGDSWCVQVLWTWWPDPILRWGLRSCRFLPRSKFGWGSHLGAGSWPLAGGFCLSWWLRTLEPHELCHLMNPERPCPWKLAWTQGHLLG